MAFIRMTYVRICTAVLLLLLGCSLLGAETTNRKNPDGTSASNRSTRSGHKVRRAAAATKNRLSAVGKKGAKSGPRGQQGIASNRAREIQEALIREHYLEGEPSGVWDQRTKDAMVRYQGENGWQTKITPDSRALIKLGLGPRHEGLLNPDSAALTPPYQLGIERPIPGGR
jgi:hypothetical protein